MSNWGSAFAPKLVEPPTPPLFDPEAFARAVAEAVTVAIAGMVLPTPQVNVESHDISELVNAVVGIRGPATAEEIAAALAPLVRPPGQGEPDVNLVEVLGELKKSLEVLDFRMKGIGTQAYGGGSVKLAPGEVVTAVGGASEATLDRLTVIAENIRRGLTDHEARLDYDASNNLIYSGKAPNGTATTATAWTIQKLGYTAGNLTRVQVLVNIAWADRATAGW